MCHSCLIHVNFLCAKWAASLARSGGQRSRMASWPSVSSLSQTRPKPPKTDRVLIDHVIDFGSLIYKLTLICLQKRLSDCFSKSFVLDYKVCVRVLCGCDVKWKLMLCMDTAAEGFCEEEVAVNTRPPSHH